MQETAGIIAGIISIGGFVPYLMDTLRGKTKPNRATWWIWVVVGWLVLASYYSSGAENTIWIPVGYAAFSLVIAIISIKYGEGGWTKLDKACLIGAGIGIIVWLLTDSPTLALAIFLFADFMGAIPTIKKSFLEPAGESLLAWVFFFTGNLINLFAVEEWTFAIASYPIYMFSLCVVVLGFLLFRPNHGIRLKRMS